MRTVGVEEELLVVDADGRPVPRGPAALRMAARRGEAQTPEQHDRETSNTTSDEADDAGDGRLEEPHLLPELKAEQLELGTHVCATLSDVDRELRVWRSRADAAARQVGARVAALATSPLVVEAQATPGRRYQRMHDVFASTAQEQLTCGCHVHVSVEDDDEGVAVLNRIRMWLPVLTAMTANSPFWQGRDSGYASFRSQAWQRWPSAGPTGTFHDAADYHRLVAALLDTGTVVDSGMVYFDARLSASWPTVEVRVADVCLRVEDAVTLAGLVRALVETAARDWRANRPVPPVRTEILRLAAWRAGRSGLGGDLVHPGTGRPAPAAEVVTALLEAVAPALADTGDVDRVTTGVGELLRRGTGADHQRRAFRESGDLAVVVRSAVDLTTAASEPFLSR